MTDMVRRVSIGEAEPVRLLDGADAAVAFLAGARSIQRFSDRGAQWWQKQQLGRSKCLVLLQGTERIQSARPVPGIVSTSRDFVVDCRRPYNVQFEMRLTACPPADWPHPGRP